MIKGVPFKVIDRTTPSGESEQAEALQKLLELAWEHDRQGIRTKAEDYVRRVLKEYKNHVLTGEPLNLDKINTTLDIDMK